MILQDRTALITGGSQGLGKAVARTFLREGAHVVLAARHADELRATADELAAGCPDPGQRVLCQTADVSRPDDVQQLVDFAHSSLGHLDILVCNAGVYGPLGPVDEVSWQEWAQAIEINLFGTVLCCRAVVPLMRRRGHGKIIALSGGGATSPLPRFSAYGASKVAVVRFVETLAAEVAQDGIDVNAVAPGLLDTRLMDQVLEADPERVGPDFHDRVARQKAEGSTPLELPADLIAFLASSESDGISGRLIAAVWDNWRDLPAIRDRLANSDVYTLRRILPEDRGWPAE